MRPGRPRETKTKMGTRLFVGNLAFAATVDDLRETFGSFGEVKDAIVMMDRETGKSRGFGFVTFANESQSRQAMSDLNGQPMLGRDIVVNEAQERTQRPQGGGGGHHHFGGSSAGVGRAPRGGDRNGSRGNRRDD